ncbi:MAG: tetratricopeptide repeat protein, partial [Bradyrhizobium sp.]|nr:tetratricopeptide repeat protein [Bradyrhizobium sp.]
MSLFNDVRIVEAGMIESNHVVRPSKAKHFRVLAAACCLAIVPELAVALSMEQAQATCRETVGRPAMQTCMAGRGRAPDAEQLREACRAKATPSVRACVLAAMNKANGRANVAIAVDDGKTRKEVIDLGNALPAGFVAPPRTIADITAVLDDEKPHPARLARLRDEADDEPDKGLSASDLAEFYLDRGNARMALGRNADATADGEKGLAIVSNGGDPMLKQRARLFLAALKQAAGDLKAAVEIFQQIIRETQNVRGMGGFIFTTSRIIMQALILSGDIVQAEGYLRRMQTYLTDVRTSGIPGKREVYNLRGRGWEADFESGRATILEARGQYREAEVAYRKASDYRKAWIPDLKKFEYAPKESYVRQQADADLLNAARAKAKQGRLAEAEADARGVLLSRLKAHGKYNPMTTRYVIGLAGVLVEQGRYADAEKLIRSALDIQRTVGIGDGTQFSAQILSQLGSVLSLQRKPDEAAAVYAELDKAIAK